jgi:glutamine synthetase
MTDLRDRSTGDGVGAGHQGSVGVVSREHLLSLIAGGEIETVVLAQVDHIGRLFGKRIEARAFAAAPDDGTFTCSINFAWDVRQEFAPGLEFAGWHTGYHDMWGRPDWASARVVPWATRTAVVLCDTCVEGGDEVGVAPRSILRRQLERARELGFRCEMASELEFHVFAEPLEDVRRKRYRNLAPSTPACQDYSILLQSPDEPFLGAVRRELTDAGIPVEGSKGEYGWGQTEVNLAHAEAMESADRHVLYKLGVKELARQHERSVTFMALPHAAGPESGSSCHIHLSLWDEIDRNVFADPGDAGQSSALMRHFLGGLMHCIPDLMPLYAPFINSYKRLRAEDFSPCTNAWGFDNRSVAFRMVGHGPSRRIENRVPGADVNPYLAYAAMIGSGLYGIEHELEPGLFAAECARTMPEAKALPANLLAALTRFVDSEVAAEILTPEVVSHFARFAELEIDSYFSVVTDWERETYFEQA